MVGAEGFEPPTFASQTQRSTRLSYTPLSNPRQCHHRSLEMLRVTPRPVNRIEAHLVVSSPWFPPRPCKLLVENRTGSTHPVLQNKNGAPGEIRTPDHLVRSQVLYPTELRAHCKTFCLADLVWGTGRRSQKRNYSDSGLLRQPFSSIFFIEIRGITFRDEKGDAWPPVHGDQMDVQTSISHSIRCDSAAQDRPPWPPASQHHPSAAAGAACFRLAHSSSSRKVVRARDRP